MHCHLLLLLLSSRKVLDLLTGFVYTVYTGPRPTFKSGQDLAFIRTSANDRQHDSQ